MKVEIISEIDAYLVTDLVNATIEKLEKENNKIIDIKFESSKSNGGSTYSVMIIYCGKDEYREVIINKILDR